ncbi:MAG: response regulator transcription factor, partial [Chloroflexota bacterium]|nr:response regulator transcription factor [Chloroflexota bacterium]
MTDNHKNVKKCITGVARILGVAQETVLDSAVVSELRFLDFDFTPVDCWIEAVNYLEDQLPDLLIVDIDDLTDNYEAQCELKRLRTDISLSIIGLISEKNIEYLTSFTGIDDFLVKPCNPVELVARIKRTLWRIGNLNRDNIITHGDLVMDLSNYEVMVAGRLVPLSFKEWELLRVLISNKGRAFDRQELLDMVWGYDYYGGDRTVDVHIRRLRSKIEDPTHTF